MQLYSVLTVIHNIQLSRNFRETKFYFRELEKTFARVSNITRTAFAIKNKTPYKILQGPLDRFPNETNIE